MAFGLGAAPYKPSPLASVKPLAKENTSSDWWFQRFSYGKAGSGTITPASNDELCLSAGPKKAVAMQPCKAEDCSKEPKSKCMVGQEYSNWQYNETLRSLSIYMGNETRRYCLSSPPKEQQWPVLSLQPCNDSDILQRWIFEQQQGGAICSSEGYREDGTPTPRCATWSGGFEPSSARLYPAVRDTKAAVRWVRAVGTPRLNIDADYITLDGGSAGASTVIPAAIAQLPGDFVREISDAQDPTLASTHRHESSSVRSVVAHWGAAYGVEAVTAADPAKRDRYAYAAGASVLPSVLEFNGLIDTTIPIQHARSIQANYDRGDVKGSMTIVPLPHEPHGQFTANVTTPTGASRTQSQVAFDWVVHDQALILKGE